MNKAAGLRSRTGLWVAFAVAALILGAAAVALGRGSGRPTLGHRADGAKPTLLLLSSLPIVFPEGFSLEGAGSPALTALESRYKVEPIDLADGASLKGQRYLLMAHPRAQPAEVLVDLDAWVRDGGRLLLLADPKLDWPSDRPLGDRLRPPPAFADTGLLKHWRLELFAPEVHGATSREIEGRTVDLSSPGLLSGACKPVAAGLVARCRIGRGRATIIADADFLRTNDPESASLQFLLAELDRIERR